MFSLNPSFSFTIGKWHKESEQETPMASQAAVIKPSCEYSPELLLMLIAIVMLSGAVLVYAARH